MLGQGNLELNFILETVNGVVLILSFPLLIVLTLYLVAKYRQPDRPLRPVPGVLPVAISLASALLIDKLGVLLTRLAVWTWRRFGAGESGGPMNEWQHYILLAGTVMSAIGCLWLIRILSRPMYGELPWSISTLLAGIYVLQRMIEHYPL